MIGVVGAGSFGLAIACALSRNGNDVVLFTRQAERAQAINSLSCLPNYESILKPERLRASSDFQEIANASKVVLAIPTQQLGEFVASHGHLFKTKSTLLLQKGIEKNTLKLPVEIVNDAGLKHVSVLSGPNFANEILQELPTATTISSKNVQEADVWALIFKSAAFRPYVHLDMKGAQIGGAIKNIIAIACGVVEGLGLGQNALAAIITRGLAEMVKLGVALGAEKETFFGLSGVGDLVLTCNSEQSRNFRFGVSLAKSEAWDEKLKGTIEGYHTAFSAVDLSKKLGIEMPITECVYQVINQQLLPKDAINVLMGRHLKQEVF